MVEYPQIVADQIGVEPLRGGQHRAQTVRPEPVVCIEHGDPRAGSLRQCDVACGAHADIFRQHDGDDSVIRPRQLFHDLRCAVPRAIVDDNEFDGADALAESGRNRLPDRRFAVISRDDDGDVGRVACECHADLFKPKMGRREGAVRCVLEVLVRASVGSNRARFPAVSVLSAVKEAAERAGFELDPYSLNQFNGLIDTPSRP